MNRVSHATILHKIFRPVLNLLGGLHGYGFCKVCRDSWYWKKGHTIPTSDRGGVFPYCQECHDTATKNQKHQAIRMMGSRWRRDLPLGPREYNSLKAAHKAVEEEA